MTFRGAVSAELTKILRRPATWCVLLLPMLGQTLLGYWFAFTSAREAASTGEEAAAGQVPFDRLLEMYSPAEYALRAIEGMAAFGPVVAAVFAILVIGSEYANDTLKTSMALARSRSTFLAAKATAITVTLVGAVAGVFLTGAVLSSVLAAMYDASPLFSPPGVFLRAFAYSVIGMLGFAALGVLLATLLRGTVLPMAVAFVYIFALEGGLQASAGTDGTSTILEALLATNVVSLWTSLRAELIVAGVDISPGRALVTIIAYILVFGAASALLLGRRDVT